MQFTCASCGQQFTGKNPNNGPHPKYCGRKCWPSNALPHTRLVPDERNCKHCGQLFSRAERGGSRAEYCSNDCALTVKYQARRDRRQTRRKPCECLICGLSLTSQRQYCPAHRNTRIRQCAQCNEQFTTTGARYCSDVCRGWTASRSDEQQRFYWRRPSNSRKRARQYGVKYEPIDKLRVFRRDGWRCGICGTKVNQHLRYPHQWSASLDHIVPMSKGGDHLYINVQCAHWICNTRKHAQGSGEQLALVG